LLFIVALSLTNCQVEEIATDENSIKTVTKEEAMFFLQQQSNTINLNGNSTSYDYNFRKITQEKLTNTAELLTVVPIITKLKKTKSKALLIKVASKIQTIIYTEYHEESSKTNSFSGTILLTKLNGDFIRAYKLKNNEYVIDLVPAKGATSKLLNLTSIELNEVIIINSYKKPSWGYVPIIVQDTKTTPSLSDLENYWWLKSGGGGPAVEPEPDTDVDPCNQIKDLLNFNTDKINNIKSNIKWLEDKVKATVNNKEAGVEVKKTMNADGSFSYEFNQVSSDQEFSIEMSTGNSYVGGFHSHPSKGDAMFSFQDVQFLLDVYDGAFPSRKGEAFNGLVCKDANGNTNTYMLKISNIDELRAQIKSIWESEKYSRFTNKEDRIKAIHKDQAIKYFNSKGALEKSFLEQFKGFGVELYKADAASNNFNKLALNNSSVTPTPCN
jgi:hypothetical protein